MSEGTVPPRRRPRRAAAWLLPTLLGVGLFALFLRRGGDAASILTALRGAARRPALLAAGVAAFAASLGCGLLRWYALLGALRLPVPFSAALRLYAIGHCFNVLGPGATGGDLAKAAWIVARVPGRRAEALSSIAAERLIGLSTTVCYLAAASFFSDFFRLSPFLVRLALAFRLFALGVAAAWLFFALAPIEALAARLPLRAGRFAARGRDLVLRAWRAVRLCLTHPRATLAAVLLSLGNVAAAVCSWTLLAGALGLASGPADLARFGVALPPADVAAALPLTPGGAGLRENAVQFLLSFVGVAPPDATALGLLMFATILFWALVCAALALPRCGARA